MGRVAVGAAAVLTVLLLLLWLRRNSNPDPVVLRFTWESGEELAPFVQRVCSAFERVGGVLCEARVEWDAADFFWGSSFRPHRWQGAHTFPPEQVVLYRHSWFPALGDEGSTLVEAVNTSSVHRVYAPWALVALGNETHRFHRGASFDAQALLTAKRHPCALLAAESDFYREFGRADADANVISDAPQSLPGNPLGQCWHMRDVAPVPHRARSPGGPLWRRPHDFDTLLRPYKFAVVMEHQQPGYVTEALLEVWAAGVVPIYYGSLSVDEMLNPDAFIHCQLEPEAPFLQDRNHWRTCVLRLMLVASNDQMYLEMLRQPIFRGDRVPHWLKDDDVAAQLVRVWGMRLQDGSMQLPRPLFEPLQCATGNLVTAQRIANHLRSAGAVVVLEDVKAHADAESLRALVQRVGATCVLGVHLWRAGRLLDGHSLLPTALVLGGTDVNENMRVMEAAVAQSVAVVAFSRTMLDAFASSFPSHAHKACIIGPAVCVDANRIALPPTVVASLAPHPRYLLLVTALRSVKDPCFLIDAVRARAREPLVVVGPVLDPQCQILFDKARADSPWIVWLGEQPAAVVHELMRCAWATVNCSVSEGLSNALLEAMSVGCAVVARANAGNCSVVQHDVNGLLFSSPAQFVAQLDRLDAVRSALVAAALETVATRFSLEAERAGYVRVLRQLANN